MSECQDYEFVALDGPISDEGLRYARGCPRRAEVSPLRWRNVYHFGGFHGNVNTLLEHYDAHFYLANWGAVRLGLVLPDSRLKPEAIEPYLCRGERYEHRLTFNQAGLRTIGGNGTLKAAGGRRKAMALSTNSSASARN